MVSRYRTTGVACHVETVLPAVRAPYLIDRHDPAQGDGADVKLDVETSTVELAVHGIWGPHLRRNTYSVMQKCLTEHPATLLIDVRGLTDPAGASATTWINARRLGAALDPAVQVLLCAAAGAELTHRLHRLGTTRVLPIFDTIAHARAVAGRTLPLTERLEVRLTPDASAAAVARQVVTDACAAWQLPTVRDRARLVASELVINAVEHAGTAVTILMSRRPDGVHITVRDGDPRPPRLADDFLSSPDAPLYHRRLGLHVVHAAATMWGAMPTNDGKVVWATIRSWSRR